MDSLLLRSIRLLGHKYILFLNYFLKKKKVCCINHLKEKKWSMIRLHGWNVMKKSPSDICRVILNLEYDLCVYEYLVLNGHSRKLLTLYRFK